MEPVNAHNSLEVRHLRVVYQTTCFTLTLYRPYRIVRSTNLRVRNFADYSNKMQAGLYNSVPLKLGAL
jgi:hypothetical protein